MTHSPAVSWPVGSVAYLWAPSRDDRFRCLRGVIADPDERDSGAVYFHSDDGGEWKLNRPLDGDGPLFVSPAACRVRMSTNDLACARSELAKIYERVALCEGEVRAAEVRLAQAVAAARDDEKEGEISC